MQPLRADEKGPTIMPTKTTRPRKTAAPAPDRPAPAVDLDADAFDPSIVAQVFLFRLGGVEYHIPAESRAGLIYEYIEIERAEGVDAAMWWMFAVLLGEDGAKAFRDYPRLTKAHIRQVQMVCLDTLMGPKG